MNKPIAWGMTKDGVIYDCICPEEHDFNEGEYTIPLYTTPQTKLSDEEIEQLREYHGINDWIYETSVVDFARAIEAKVRGQ